VEASGYSYVSLFQDSANKSGGKWIQLCFSIPGQCQQEWRQVDHPAEEGAGVSVLGEPDHGHVRGAVHGG